MLTASAAMVVTLPAPARQTTGTPGSSSATTTVDGKYLPNPPAKFGGIINMQASDSKPCWPTQGVPPKGAPNIPFIMTIDETFDIGSDLRTPVDDKDYQVPFAFTGKISKLIYKLGPVPLSAADKRTAEEMLKNVNN